MIFYRVIESSGNDTLTEQGLAERDDADEALLSRLQQTRARMNDKLDESEENANSHMEKMKKLKDIKENISSKKIQNVVKERIQRKKLEGVTRALIATSSKSKDDDNSDGSIETNLEGDPDKLQSFLSTIESYGIEKEDIDKIVFKGGGNYRKPQYPLLQQIAKQLFQQNNSKEFLNQISDKSDSGKHKIKNVVELNKALEKLKKK